MRKRPIFPIIKYFLAITLCLSFVPIFGQGDDYYISHSGVNGIYCNEPVAFFLNYNGNLVWTEWSIEPWGSMDFLYMDNYSMTAEFYSIGTYWVIASSFTYDSLLLSDTILVQVIGNFSYVEVLSCNERNPDTECYRVCSQSPTILQLYQGAEFEIVGAIDYYMDWQSNILEVNWSDAGGVIYFIEQCGYSICFEVFPPSKSEFTTVPPDINDTVRVCINEEIYFDNTSTSGVDYLWIFGDGAQSNNYDASHSFSAAGFYTVTLQSESICDCSTDKEIVIEVLPAPAPTL